MVGAFHWLANMTRHEIAYAVSQLGRFLTNPGIKHFNAALRLLMYLDGSRSRCLVFAPRAELPLHVFVDSSWASKFFC